MGIDRRRSGVGRGESGDRQEDWGGKGREGIDKRNGVGEEESGDRQKDEWGGRGSVDKHEWKGRRRAGTVRVSGVGG